MTRVILVWLDSLLKSLGFLITVACVYEYIHSYFISGDKMEIIDIIMILLMIYFYLRVVIDWIRDRYE